MEQALALGSIEIQNRQAVFKSAAPSEHRAPPYHERPPERKREEKGKEKKASKEQKEALKGETNTDFKKLLGF